MKGRILAVAGLAALLSGCAASRYATAEGQVKRKDYVQALRTYLRALEPHAREGKRFIYYEREAVTGIGVVYWHMQRYETALKILRLVMEKDPDYGKPVFYAGLCHEAMGEDEAALAMYRRFPKIAPSDPFRHVLAGRFDFVVKRKIEHEIETALKNEDALDPARIPERSVAVLSFLSLSESRDWEPLQKGLADMVITDLSQVGEITVVERMKMDLLLSELGMSAAGLADSTAGARLGNLVGARYLVKGSYLVMSDLKMTLDAGIFPFRRLSEPSSFNEDGSLSRIFQMEKQLVLDIVDYFGITLTPQKKQDLMEIPTQDIQAFVHYCNGLSALDANDYRAAFRFFQSAVRSDPGFQKARDWLIVQELWDATHAQNLVRVDREVALLTRGSMRGRLQADAVPDFLSTTRRLQWMGSRQNAGFLPGTDSRKPFQEAGLLVGAPILPERLGSPPGPPAR